jgi:hypothetical protein
MPAYYQSFLAKCEGVESPSDDDNSREMDHMLMNIEIEDEYDTYFTEFGEVDSAQTVTILNDQSTWHAVTGGDMFNTSPLQLRETSTFTFEDRYSSEVFQGIIPDGGAAGVSTAGQFQFLALQKLDASVDTATAGAHKIHFGKGTALSQGTIQVPHP